MKQFKQRSKRILLPLCILLAFGLTSCQDDELIPLDEKSLAGDGASIDISEATGILIGENGKATAYYDKEFNMYDAEGNAMETGDSNRVDISGRSIVTVYEQADYKGNFTVFNISHGTQGGFSFNLADYGWDNRVRSIVVSPNMVVQLAADANMGGTKQYFGVLNNSPKYENTLPSGLSGTVSSIYFVRGSLNDGTKMCGMMYDQSNYGITEKKIPVFKEQDLLLTDVGFNDIMSSFAANDFSDCDGLMFYQHTTFATDINQNYEWFSPDRDDPNVANSSETSRTNRALFGASRVKESTRRVHKFQDVANLSKGVGLVFFSNSDFTGHVSILEKNVTLDEGRDGSGSVLNSKAHSFVVAPNCTVRFDDSPLNLTPGYYVNANIDFHNAFVSCANIDNDFCGVAYANSNTSGKALPIFNELYNYTISDGTDILRLENISGANNIYSSFSSTNATTNCKGVTFWERGGNALPDQERIWYPVDPVSPEDFVFPSAMNNQVSGITTQGCTTCATGFSVNAYNEGVNRHNTIFSAYYDSNSSKTGGFTGSSAYTRLVMNAAKNHATNVFIPLAASTILTYFGVEPWQIAAVSGTGTAVVACGIEIYRQINLAKNSFYINRSFYPDGGRWVPSNYWMAGNMKNFALLGYYFDNEADYNLSSTNFLEAMKKAKFAVEFPSVNVPLDLVSVEAGTVNFQNAIANEGYAFFSLIVEKAESYTTPGATPTWAIPVKNWLAQNIAAQKPVLTTDYYLSGLTILRESAAGVWGGFLIGAGIDAVAAQVRVNPTDLKNKYTQEAESISFPTVSPTSLSTTANCTNATIPNP